VQKAITYVGLDVHKDSIVVSLAEAGLRGRLREVREYGKVLNTPAALKAMATKLAAGGNELRFCYEAGLAATASSDSSVRWDTTAPSLLRRWCRESRGSGSRLTVGMRQS
jgi:hypothetical protein